MNIKQSSAGGFRLVMVLFLALTMGACKALKEAKNSTGIPKKLDKTLTLVEGKNPQYQTLTISGKARLDVPKEGVNVRLSYRMNMIKDSLIWIRVSKLGVEAVRVLIKRDSIYALDNLSERYIRSGFEPANKYTGLDLDFDLLQDLLLGNLQMIPNRVDERPSTRNDSLLVLFGSENGTGFTYTLDKDWLKLIKIHALNPSLLQETEISYGGFQAFGKGLLPHEGSIEVSQPEKIGLDFTHSRVRVNPEKFSVKFRIPKGYTLVSG